MLINVMLVCSISTIFFGFLFGEFLGYNMSTTGFLGFNLAWLYPHAVTIGPIGPFSLPLERLVAGGPSPEYNGSYIFGIKDLLVLTCVVGVCQILLGYAFGFRNEYRQHGLKTAILHKVSWALMLIGGVAMVWYAFPHGHEPGDRPDQRDEPIIPGGRYSVLHRSNNAPHGRGSRSGYSRSLT